MEKAAVEIIKECLKDGAVISWGFHDNAGNYVETTKTVISDEDGFIKAVRELIINAGIWLELADVAKEITRQTTLAGGGKK
jgi:hypothetical protein